MTEPGRTPAASPNRLLLEAARHGGPAVALLALTSLALAAAETLFPMALSHAIDAALTPGRDAWLLALVVLVAVIAGADAVDELAAGVVTARSTAWVRGRLVSHVLAVGTAATERTDPGDLVGRIVGNSGQIGRMSITAIRTVTGLLPAIGGPVGLALIDPWLCLTFLVGLPLLYLAVVALRRDVRGVAERYLAAQGQIAGRLLEALGGARTIAAAGKLDTEAERVVEPLGELRRHGEGLWRAQMRIAVQNSLLVALLEVAVLAVAGFELAAGRITPGQLLAAAQYVLLGTTITSCLSSAAALARAQAAAGRITEILAEPPRRCGSRRLGAGAGQLEFRGVRVGGCWTAGLRGLDLTLPAGSLVAIVGSAGAGKSLLAAVAGGLVGPDAGEVRLDGVPLAELHRGDLRAAVTYAFARPALVGPTVGDAIALGPRRPPLYELVEAAGHARADAFIRRLPRRYGTPLSEAPMSGGEIQRIGLARAFAHAGRVVILDDVAAALDTVTEHEISDVLLRGTVADRTRIIIARRVSTAAAADLVVWLEAGAVRAAAPHAELWAHPGYRALFAGDRDGGAGGAPPVGLAVGSVAR